MKERLVEHLFFFGLFGLVGYIVWQIISPFIASLALAAIIATVCYPLYVRVIRMMPRNNRALAAFISVVLIALTIFLPLIALSYVLFTQAVAFYESANGGGLGLAGSITILEHNISSLVPGLSVDLMGYIRQGAGWLASHMGAVFAGTASTVAMLFIMLIGLFYMFKDGAEFAERLIRISPLPDTEDRHILEKLSTSVRSVVLGTLTVAVIQGILTGIGFAFFQIPQAVLWGSVAAIGALIPGVGTSVVFIVAILFSWLGGSHVTAILLAAWGMIAVGLIDNFLGPYLMSRGAKLHPFAVLLSVLGGVTLFGPVGFLVGPVALSFFTVLLELYNSHIRSGPQKEKHAR